MPSLSTLLGLAAVYAALVSANPIFNGRELRQLDKGLEKRQEVEGDDFDTDASTGYLRDAFNYASAFSAQPTVTYSAVSVGAAPSDATQIGTTTVSPGNNAVGSPPDTAQQGNRYVVDHILELQFVVGAFSVNPRPTMGTTSIPLLNWNSASVACFTSGKNYAPKTAVASAFSNAFNLQGIPERFNNFKAQVFTGRLQSQPDKPSDRTYPTDFGPALQKFLDENQQGAFSVIDDVGAVLAGRNVGNYSAIKDYFVAYAQGEYQSAISFLSTWTGTPYAATSTSSTQTSASATAITTAPPNSIGPLTDCSLVQTTLTGTIANGPQTYCQCGSIIAGINTETSGSLLYTVCAGDPYPTVATGTITAPAPVPTCNCNENGCTDDSPGCCGTGTCDQDGTCNTPNCT